MMPVRVQQAGAAKDLPLPPVELEVAAWRHETLLRAGYPSDVALAFAYRVDVDLHLAVALLERGATLEQAIRILD